MVYSDRLTGPVEKKAQKTRGALFTPDQVDKTILQTIDYEYPEREITVEMNCDEFTCVCPFSGLPDFASLTIRYTPRKKLVEMKSLKYYLYAFRNVKIYNEHAVNKILVDLTRLLSPRRMTIEGRFTARGGITNTVIAVYPSRRPKK
jgi:7-cyano-7-deazaguanine reductase